MAEQTVKAIDEFGRAARAGVAVGDELLRYNGLALINNASIEFAIKDAKEKRLEKVGLEIRRGGELLTLQIEPGPLGATLSDPPRPSLPQTLASRQAAAPAPTKYGFAKGVANFVLITGWAMALVGVLVAALALGEVSRYASIGQKILVALPGIGLLYSGCLGILWAQITSATLDNADHTREILAYLRASQEAKRET